MKFLSYIGNETAIANYFMLRVKMQFLLNGGKYRSLTAICKNRLTSRKIRNQFRAA